MKDLHFWESDVWSWLLLFAVLLGSLLVGNTLRRKIPLLRNSLIPTSVIGGGVLLIVAAIYKLITKEVMFDTAVFGGVGTENLEIITGNKILPPYFHITKEGKYENNGYIFEIENNVVKIKQVPLIVAQNHAENILEDVLECLNTNFDKVEESILIMSSCKGAVKAGQTLSTWQMQDIIEKWQTTKNPQTCPHGRPISKVFPAKEVAKFFLRN